MSTFKIYMVMGTLLLTASKLLEAFLCMYVITNKELLQNSVVKRAV